MQCDEKEQQCFDKHYFLSLSLQCKTLLAADILFFGFLIIYILLGLFSACVLRCDSAFILCLKASFFAFCHTMKRQPHQYSVLSIHNKERKIFFLSVSHSFSFSHCVVRYNSYIKYTVSCTLKKMQQYKKCQLGILILIYQHKKLYSR